MHTGAPRASCQVERLVPADGLPLVRAAFAHALHGVQHVARAVDQVQLVQALRAQRALAERAVLVALDLHCHAVLGVHPARAVVVAVVAHGVVLDALHARLGERLVGLGQGAVGGKPDRSGRACQRRKLGEAAARHGCARRPLLVFHVFSSFLRRFRFFRARTARAVRQTVRPAALSAAAPALVSFHPSSHTRPPVDSSFASRALG